MASVKAILREHREEGRFTLRIDGLRIGSGWSSWRGPTAAESPHYSPWMAGVLRPNRGRIAYSVDGMLLDVEEAWSRLRLGFLFDSVEPPDATVEQLLDMTCLEDCSDIIGGLGLRKVLAERYSTLSTGYGKRVKLALAYARRPCVALIDEPFNGMDYDSIWAIREFIAEQAAKRYTLTIIASE